MMMTGGGRESICTMLSVFSFREIEKYVHVSFAFVSTTFDLIVACEGIRFVQFTYGIYRVFIVTWYR